MPSMKFALSGSSPDRPGTEVLGVHHGIESYRACLIHAVLRGAEGGDLRAVLQSATDALAPTWFDVAAFPVVPAGAAPQAFTVTLTRGQAAGVIAAANVDPNVPTLTPGTALDRLGGALRLIVVAGEGTTRGTEQTLSGLASD